MEMLAVVSQKLMGQQICCLCPYTFSLFSVADQARSSEMTTLAAV